MAGISYKAPAEPDLWMLQGEKRIPPSDASLNIPQPLMRYLYDALHEGQGSPDPESIPRH